MLEGSIAFTLSGATLNLRPFFQFGSLTTKSLATLVQPRPNYRTQAALRERAVSGNVVCHSPPRLWILFDEKRNIWLKGFLKHLMNVGVGCFFFIFKRWSQQCEYSFIKTFNTSKFQGMCDCQWTFNGRLNQGQKKKYLVFRYIPEAHDLYTMAMER